MQLTPLQKRLIRSCVLTVILVVIAGVLLKRSGDRAVDEGLKQLMSERVQWKCVGCSRIQLVPVTGQHYQPRNWTRLEDIPRQMSDAIIAVEDKRFYSHAGIDFYRTFGALLVALRNHESPRGTSTLTQQLARIMFTSKERTLSRKFREALYALALERRLSKRTILELYLNTVPFGNAGPYEIVGVADAARAFLAQDLAQLQPAGIALIAGTIQRPVFLNPRREVFAVQKRRDLVLKLMRLHGVISAFDEAEARKAPVKLAELQDENAHYLQLAARELSKPVSGAGAAAVEATLSLDARLQHAALEAVHRGIEKMNQRPGTQSKVEAALVALDPQTGAVRALVGGSRFLTSQVNRTLSQRQPGSVFKPFVYAAAFEYGSTSGALGPFSEVNDIPRQFSFHGLTYAPHNYGGVYNGRVTLQQALLQSLNIPAVRLAEVVGYSHVTELAEAAGLKGIGPTPSAALGSYEVSPLALAGAYTAFANQGIAVKPYFIERVTNWEGKTLRPAPVQATRVMRVETAQLMVSMLRGVVQYGTAWSAGRLPFAAAGKTGTDDDGWFVGFTDKLLCVVWVGYDDNRNLRLEGAKSALPIWIDFMSAAYKVKDYKFGNQLPGPSPAQMYRAIRNVDAELPDETLDELIATAATKLVVNVKP